MRLSPFSCMTAAYVILALSGCGSQDSRTGAGEQEAAGIVELQILAINDFHGNLEASPGELGGAAYLAAHLRQAEATADHTVIVSAGDLIGASPLISSLFHDEPTIEAANLWGLDINAAGNHEFDEGWNELLRMQYGGAHPVDGTATGASFEGADFQILAANVVVEDTGETLLPPYAIKHYEGVPVAFIGMPLQGTPTVVVSSGVAGLTFKDEAETINRFVEKIKEQSIEAIVVVIHQGGYPEDGGEDDCSNFAGPIVDIVENSDPAVDLFVTGHTHKHYLCRVDGRPVTSAGKEGRYYTDIDVRLDRRTGDMRVVGVDNVPVTHDIEPAADVAALVDNYSVLVDEISNAVVGTITADFTEAPNSAGESLLGALIADAQLAATQSPQSGAADVAFMNKGGIRTDLLFEASGSEEDGQVTFAEISATQPFGNILVTMTLTGAQIDTLLEQQWAGQPAPDILMPSLGFSYAWSRSAPDGERVVPSSIRIDGVVIDPAGSYRVTVNSFLAGGGDGFPVLRKGTERVEGIVDVAALKEFLRARSPFAPVPLDRIQVLP